MNVEVTEEIKKHVETLLAYMDDERKDYEGMVEDGNPESKNHIWIDIQAIAKWLDL